MSKTTCGSAGSAPGGIFFAFSARSNTSATCRSRPSAVKRATNSGSSSQPNGKNWTTNCRFRSW